MPRITVLRGCVAGWAGRVRAHADVFRLGDLIRMYHDQRAAAWPSDVPLGGELTVPAFDASPKLDAISHDSSLPVGELAARWARATARAGGLVVLG